MQGHSLPKHLVDLATIGFGHERPAVARPHKGAQPLDFDRTALLYALDRLGNGSEWVFWGTPNCGKGQPLQIGHTGHPAVPARFRNVRVGVR